MMEQLRRRWQHEAVSAGHQAISSQLARIANALEDRPAPGGHKSQFSASRLLDSAEAAAVLGISRDRLYRLVKAGTIHARRVGRRLLFVAGDLKLDSSRTSSPPAPLELASTRRRNDLSPLLPVSWDSNPGGL
jgi:excisionase family DNA binding protein